MTVKGDLALDAKQLREHIVRPTLVHIDLWSDSAENLVVGTALQESHIDYVKQLGCGPALGICQMEPNTHDDIWENYLRYKPGLADRIDGLLAPWPEKRYALVTNLAYAVAMCRIHYRRVPARLPPAQNVAELAAYWKRHYNTHLGAGKVEEFVRNYRHAA